MQTLHQLALADASALEQWLAERYRDLYGPDPALRWQAARLDDFGIARRDSFLDGLAALHGRLPPAAQARFQRALAALLRHARPGHFPVQAMNELVLLIGLTGAHEQVQVFEPVLGSGAWGEAAPELFFCAIAVLKGLRSGEEAYLAAWSLLGCRTFPLDHVFDAYEVLIGSRPAQWAADLAHLAPALLAREQQVLAEPAAGAADALARRYARLVQEILLAVSLERLAQGLQLLARRTDELRLSHPVGRVVDLLARGDSEAGVRLVERHGRFVFERSHPAPESRLFELSAAGELFLEGRVPREAPTGRPTRSPQAPPDLSVLPQQSALAPASAALQAAQATVQGVIERRSYSAPTPAPATAGAEVSYA